MYPTMEEIKKIVAEGQYKGVPVCREVYADRYTPVDWLGIFLTITSNTANRS